MTGQADVGAALDEVVAVYLAAPYGARERIRRYATELEAAGFVVTSTWLRETHEINAGTQGAATSLPDDTVAAHAEADMADIDQSDALVLFTAKHLGIEGGGGRHIETGYALARHLPVVVVGEPENVFHRLGAPRVTLAGNLTGVIAALRGGAT